MNLQVPPNCDLTLGLRCVDKSEPGHTVWEMRADERFANPGNVTFSVLASTNLGLPLADWTVLGTATNIGGGLYQFGNPVSPELPQRFYRLRFP